MAEMTTEQLLIGLGQAVMAIGSKIDTLTEKMDDIFSVLSKDIAVALKEKSTVSTNEVSIDMKPLIDKLEEIKEMLKGRIPESSENGESTENANSTVLIERIQSIEKVLTDSILTAINDIGNNDTNSDKLLKIDLNPIVEKLDVLTQILNSSKNTEEIKSLLLKLESAINDVPPVMAEKLKDIKDSDTSNPFKAVELKIVEVSGILGEILKSTQDHEYVSILNSGISELKEQFISSESEIITVVKEIPTSIIQMGGSLSDSMSELSKETSVILEKADKKLNNSTEKLIEIKEELQKGLELNTNMTNQMVELTSRFTDKAEEDRVKSFNTSAVNHFNRGEFAESDLLFKQALEIAPENQELLCNYAYLKAAMEKIEESEELFRKAIEVDPNLEIAISGLGMLMVKAGRSEETIEFLKNTIINGEPSVRTIVAYTRALAALGQHDKAVELLESTKKAVPNNPDIIEELAKYGHEDQA